MLMATLGSLNCRGGLHSHTTCFPSRTRGNCTFRQTRSLRSHHVLVQLSAGYLLGELHCAYHVRSTPVPIVHAPPSRQLSPTCGTEDFCSSSPSVNVWKE